MTEVLLQPQDSFQHWKRGYALNSTLGKFMSVTQMVRQNPSSDPTLNLLATSA
jgi:hypothetical protein